MNNIHIYIPVLAALVALMFAVMKYLSIMKQDEGSSEMKDIAKMIQDGAFAFLKAEYTWLAVFVAFVFVAIAVSPAELGLGIRTAVAFLCGAVASGLAGFFGDRKSVV